MKPSERINRPLTLQEMRVEILLDRMNLGIPITAVLEMTPRPGVVFKFSLRDVMASNEIHSKREVQVRLMNGSVIPMMVGNRRHLEGGSLSNILVPKEEPITVLDEGLQLARCKFALINFPSIWGEQDITRPKFPDRDNPSLIFQHFFLELHPWLIKIYGVDSLMSVDHRLKEDGGSAITHVGNITRKDGSGFDVDQLYDLLDALHLFLSFTRGSYCGITLLSGQDSNRKPVWRRLGTYKVEPWYRALQSWFDSLHNETLSSIFQGFWKTFNNAKYRDPVREALHWYLRGNQSIEPEVKIDHAQAALEMICSIPELKSTGRAGKRTAYALRQIGIDYSVPPHLKEIENLRAGYNQYEPNQKNWLRHGPDTLAAIRNDSLHPENRLGYISPVAYEEASSLGLHYVELSLLWLFGHEGKYVNRLNHGVQDVPWA